MKIEQVLVGKLKPAEYNPRRFTPNAIAMVKTSIERFGIVDPIIVNASQKRKNIVIGGHLRLFVAKELGMKEVPVVFVKIDDIERERELNLRLNKNVGEWDFDLLADFDKDMLLDVGFETEELDKIFPVEPEEKDDEVPEVPEDPKSKLGDIYLLGRHRVMCGDSTNLDDVEKLMDGKKADMVFTDPPYGIDYEGGSKKREKLDNDAIAVLPFYTEVFTNALVVSKKGAPAYVWHASTETHNAIRAFIDSGWDYKQYIIWNKNNSTFGRQDFHWKHEPCIYGWVKGSAHKWYGDRKQTTVWDIDRPSRSEEHSTMKPVELCTKGLYLSSKEDDIVLDLFLGSGSTLIACEKTNRICYGMELDPKYVDVIVKRWEDYTGSKAEKL